MENYNLYDNSDELLATEAELDKANKELAWELSKSAVDVAGLVDPTPISDTIGAAMSLSDGDFIGAGLSLISIVPYAGDAIGKTAKGARTIARLNKLRKKITALSAKAKKLRGSKKAVNSASDAIDGTKNITKTSSNSAASKCQEGNNPPGFSGRLRGENVELPGVKKKKIEYTKRNKEDLNVLRKEFDSKKRPEFVKGLAGDPEKVKKLKEAGLTDTDIKLMQDGKIPNGWQVHHKLPLDDGGTNNPSNLVLIKNEPFHKVITNTQNELVKDLSDGQTRTVDFPIPDGFVYPP